MTLPGFLKRVQVDLRNVRRGDKALFDFRRVSNDRKVNRRASGESPVSPEASSAVENSCFVIGHFFV